MTRSFIYLSAEAADRLFYFFEYLCGLHQLLHTIMIGVQGSIFIQMLNVLADDLMS